MSAPTRNLSKYEQRKCGRYPCDGVPRYVVKGQHDLVLCPRLTYNEAYEAILTATGCRKTDDGDGHVFNREAIRRMGILNGHYWRVARPFITAEYQKKLMDKARQMAEAKKAKDAAAAAQVPPINPAIPPPT